MIPALGIRLNKADAVCDEHAIYMDGQAIAIKPVELDRASWHAFCRFVCGQPPRQDRLQFAPPAPDDPEAWARIEKYMRPHEHSRGGNEERLALERSSKRGKK